MSTFLPYRGEVYCSLGNVISGRFADSYLQQAGLVLCRGQVQLAGIYRPPIGQSVSFAFGRGNGNASRLPRTLRVLSSFADPFLKITTVQLGCSLTMLQDNREPETKATPQDTNPSLPIGWENYFAAPVAAADVAAKCLAALGITAAGPIPLENYFTVDFIDLSAGYVEVLGKLLESECLIGWINAAEQLEVRSLLDASVQTGPLFSADNVFSLSDIGVGGLPGEAVSVTYNPIQLKDTSITVGVSPGLGGNWSQTTTYGFPVQVSIPYSTATGNATYDLSYVPLQVAISTFQSDRLTQAETTSSKPYPVANGSYVGQLLSAGIGFPDVPVENRSVTFNRYGSNGEVIERTDIEYVSAVEYAGSLNLPFVFGPTDFVAINSQSTVIREKTITSYQYSESVVRRSVARYQNWAMTPNGQQAVSQGRDTLPNAAAVSAFFNSLAGEPAYVGTEITITDAGPQVQERPGPARLAIEQYGTTGTREDRSVELEYLYGTSSYERVVTFQLPYSGDDYFIFSFGSWVPQNYGDSAKAKAVNYGRTQNRLRLGNRQGVSLQVPVELLPTRPFDPMFLQVDGLTGEYRANGMVWTFDQNGIVGQVDALFWSATGSTGTPGAFWFPVPPGASSLPTAPSSVVNVSPAPANTAPLPGGWDPGNPDLVALFTALPTATPAVHPEELSAAPGLEPYEETLALELVPRAVMSFEEFNYSLVPETIELDLVPRVVMEGEEQAIVQVPVTGLTLTSYAPTISLGSQIIQVPVTGLTLTAYPPTVTGSVVVSVPVTALTLTSYVPTSVGPPTDPNFANVSLLLPMNGSNGSTSFPDNSSNVLTVTAAGNAQISTAQSKWGGASGLFDGTGDELTVANSTVLEFESGGFTIECYLRFTSLSGEQGIYSKLSGAPSVSGVAIRYSAANSGVRVVFANSNSSDSANMAWSPSIGVWYHFACSRDGNSVRVFIDGNQIGSTLALVNATTFGTNSNDGSIGFTQTVAGSYFNGFIDDFRITKGLARYVANFTPPTDPFPTQGPPDPDFADVSLLLPLNGSNGSTTFTDASSNGFTVTANGNAQISTAQSKWGGSSLLLDGSGDYLSIASNAAFNFGTGDFTVEAWIRADSYSGDWFIASASGSGGLFFGWTTSQIPDGWGCGRAEIAWDLVRAASPSTAVWYHVALCRSGTSLRVFVDGTQVGATSTNSQPYDISTGSLTIGSQGADYYFSGYIDDLRITKGVARYTADFTPPTEAFPTS